MADFCDEYAAAEDVDEQYGLLRDEMARLRGLRDEIEFFDDAAVGEHVRRLAGSVDGDLLVFVANDFGRPLAYRPAGIDRAVQDEVRRAVLRDKYDDSNDDLDAIRRELLAAHPAIHKAIVAEHDDGRVRYHLPEGSSDATNFLTVREMVGLIDYTTNSAQRDGLCRTY